MISVPYMLHRRHHGCVSFQELNSARDRPQAPELSHLCCQLRRGPAPTQLCQGSATPRHCLRATGPGTMASRSRRWGYPSLEVRCGRLGVGGRLPQLSPSVPHGPRMVAWVCPVCGLLHYPKENRGTLCQNML